MSFSHFAMCFNHPFMLFSHVIIAQSRYRIPNLNLILRAYYPIILFFYLVGCNFHLILLKRYLEAVFHSILFSIRILFIRIFFIHLHFSFLHFSFVYFFSCNFDSYTFFNRILIFICILFISILLIYIFHGVKCFCGMVHQRKAFSFISSRDHCQRF